MSASVVLASLEPSFQPKMQQLIVDCLAAGIAIVPYFGLRSPADQARLWRQSRATAEVQSAIQMLQQNRAPWLASVLDGVGPQPNGPWRTNALPGASWHQYGTACDCYVEREGKPVWNGSDPGYAVYADKAEVLGLTAGARWHTPDTDHVQLDSANSPRSAMSWADIDAAMQAKFGTV